jgi:hypothetical protein
MDGVPAMTEALGNAKQLNFIVEKIFGSASVLAEQVRFFFYLSIVAHVAEAIWAVYKCQSVLKLKFQACLMWFLTVSAVGYPIFKSFSRCFDVVGSPTGYCSQSPVGTNSLEDFLSDLRELFFACLLCLCPP